MPGPTPITITADLKSIAGAAATTGARLRISLCGFGSSQPSIAGSSLLAQTYSSQIYSGTVLSFQLYGNDIISPAETFYCIRVEDAKGNTIAAADYIFTGSTAIDLSSAQPISPFFLTEAVPNGVMPGRRFRLPTSVYASAESSTLYYNGLLSPNFSAANRDLVLDFDAQPGDSLYLIYTTGDYGSGPIFKPFLAIANGPFPGRFYTLPTPPPGAQFAGVFYNGGLQLPSQYTRTASTLTMNFDTAEGDTLLVLYYVGPALPTIAPATILGAYPGTVYTIPAAPAAGLFWLYLNGQFLRPGIDYILSGVTITLFVSTQLGDLLYAYSGT